MNKKALIVSSVASMIDKFNISNIDILKKLGFEVHVACNFNDSNPISSQSLVDLDELLKNKGVVCHQIDFSRNPFHFKKILKSGKQLDQVLRNDFSIVHSHSPIGGALARILSSKYRNKGLVSIYTAHGFHFHEKSNLFSWMLYYPIELILSRKTDVLITINNEDYELAKKRMNSIKTVYIPSIGIDLESINEQKTNVSKKRFELDIDDETFIIVSIGELNDNKNHITSIRALKDVSNPNFCYLICGSGPLLEKLQQESIKLGLRDKINFLGYREDVIEILKISDLFIFPSKREGLGMAALEAMACGLPLLTSNVHGINDYSENGISGFKCAPLDVSGFSCSINKVMHMDEQELRTIKKNNRELVKRYDKEIVIEMMTEIYERSMVVTNETK